MNATFKFTSLMKLKIYRILIIDPVDSWHLIDAQPFYLLSFRLILIVSMVGQGTRRALLNRFNDLLRG